MISLFIRFFSPSQLEKEWIESTAFLLEGEKLATKGSRIVGLAASLMQAACCSVCLVSWSPTVILIDLKLICQATGKSKFLHSSVSLPLWLSLSLPSVHAKTLRKTISRVLLIGGKNVSQAFYFGRQGKKVVATYRASCLFYSIQLHKNLVN